MTCKGCRRSFVSKVRRSGETAIRASMGSAGEDGARRRRVAPVCRRGRKFPRAGSVAERDDCGGDLLADRRFRAIQQPGADDRRSDEAGHLRHGRHLNGGLWARVRMRSRFPRYVGGRAARRGCSRSRPTSKSDVHGSTDPVLPRGARDGSRGSWEGQPLRFGQARARDATSLPADGDGARPGRDRPA